MIMFDGASEMMEPILGFGTKRINKLLFINPALVIRVGESKQILLTTYPNLTTVFRSFQFTLLEGKPLSPFYLLCE